MRVIVATSGCFSLPSPTMWLLSRTSGLALRSKYVYGKDTILEFSQFNVKYFDRRMKSRSMYFNSRRMRPSKKKICAFDQAQMQSKP